MPASGALEQLLNQPQHAQQALQLLQELVRSQAVCRILTSGLEEGLQPESEAATAPGQSKPADQDTAAQLEEQPDLSDMDADADDSSSHTIR